MKKVLIVAALLLSACSANYSDGSRVGVLRKFSRKGTFYKSWEGEMLLNFTSDPHGAIVPEVFEFSLDPQPTHGEDVPALVAALNKALDSGKRTRLTYVQDTRPRISLDSQYLIQKVEILDP